MKQITSGGLPQKERKAAAPGWELILPSGERLPAKRSEPEDAHIVQYDGDAERRRAVSKAKLELITGRRKKADTVAALRMLVPVAAVVGAGLAIVAFLSVVKIILMVAAGGFFLWLLFSSAASLPDRERPAKKNGNVITNVHVNGASGDVVTNVFVSNQNNGL